MILNFDDGYKTYEINGDPNRVIKINPADVGILKRLQAAQDSISALQSKYNSINTPEALAECDKDLRAIIDDVFAAPVADIAFGGSNCLSLAGGSSIYENFLNAIIPIVQETVKEESKASEKRISKYTDRVK